MVLGLDWANSIVWSGHELPQTYGLVRFMPKFATLNLWQTVPTTKSVASKIETTLVIKFGKKISL